MKKMLGLVLSMVMTAALVGCGTNQKSTTTTAAPETTVAATEAETTAAETTVAATEAAAETTAVETEAASAETTASVETTAAAAQESEPQDVADASKHHITISVKNYGDIQVELDESIAPITVANFLKLAGDGFYDGLTFHRIIDGFMIQGGDPDGNGMGGADTTIKGEFDANGVKNPLPHVRGTISMARSQDFDSASSQFFIVQTDSPHLNGQYASFGTVTEGMEIVDQICKDTKVEDGNGAVLPENQPVIESIKVLD